MDPHKKEWELLKEKYRYMLNTGFTKEPTMEQLRFRIECIDELLNQANDKELNHFR